MQENLRTILGGSWGVFALGCLFWLLPTANDPVMQGFALVGFMATASFALVLRSRHAWSPGIIAIGGGLMILVSPLIALANPLIGGALFILSVLTIIFTWKKSNRAALDPKTSVRTAAQKLGAMIVLVLLSTALVGYLMYEAYSMRDTLTRSRVESLCKDPTVDIEACGQLAIVRVDTPTSQEEMLAGRELLDTMCQNGHAVACRRSSYARWTRQIEKMTYKDVPGELWTLCQKDGGTACLAFALGEYPVPENFIGVTRSRCSSSDLDACIAWAIGAPDSTKEAHIKSCELGTSGSCSYKGVPDAFRKTACQKTNDPWSCFMANTDTPTADLCDHGVWPTCDPTHWSAPRWGQITWATRQGLEPADAPQAWDGLRAGREIIRKRHVSWRPESMTLDEIDKTFGASCDAGVVYGCLEGANAATNVLLEHRTPERIDHAEKLLDKGCELGNYLSCWLPLSLKEYSPEQTLIKARRACYTAPRGVRAYPELCRTYAHAWMAKAGVTPWVMDTTLHRPAAVQRCQEQKDHYLCLAISSNARFDLSTPIPTAMPEHVVGRDAALISCAKNNSHGCEDLIRFARVWPVKPEQSTSDLVESICAKVPTMCESARKAHAMDNFRVDL